MAPAGDTDIDLLLAAIGEEQALGKEDALDLLISAIEGGPLDIVYVGGVPGGIKKTEGAGGAIKQRPTKVVRARAKRALAKSREEADRERERVLQQRQTDLLRRELRAQRFGAWAEGLMRRNKIW